MAGKMVLARSTPEAEGISSTAVLNFIEAVEQHPDHPLDAVQGFMLLRHGKVAAEGWWAPYGPDSPHILYSLSKSFTSTAIGLAVAEGLLSVEDPVLKFFPEDAPANPSENLKAMRVRHLLSMNTGHHDDTTMHVFQHRPRRDLFGLKTHPLIKEGAEREDNWVRQFLSLPVEHAPGTWFVYNTAATYMLSAIITRLAGESLLDYLRPRLFEPLGIEGPAWETDPRGINIGGSGLHIRLEDIARFGQLYLQKGEWDGRRILPEAWVAEASKPVSDNSNTQTNPDWTVGYGYQFWRCRHNGYRGDGAFGQYCIIMPDQDVVLAMISGVRDMQVVLDKVWEHLLPAMEPQALPADSQAYGALSVRLANLSLPLAEGSVSSPGAEKWTGKAFRLESAELQLTRVALVFNDAGSTLLLGDDAGLEPIQVGYGVWLPGTTRARGQAGEPVAACGAWADADTYEVRICFYEGEFCPVLRFRFSDEALELEAAPNVSWGPVAPILIKGYHP